MQRWGEKIAGRPFLGGNEVHLARNGPQILLALQAAIGLAHSRIDMESYEFKDNEGEIFSSLLAQKRREGLQVELIYDGWGSAGSGPIVTNLRKDGVTVLEYNPLTPNARTGLDLNDRDHRKLLVVDGRTAITGGANITDVYTNHREAGVTDPDEMAWRDTDVVIHGPVVSQFEAVFLQTWTLQHGPTLPPPPPTPSTPVGDALMQALDGAPQAGLPEIYRSLLVCITLAQRSVHLTTGFFVPPPDMQRVLENAALRGVDVSLVVPSESDSVMSVYAGRATYAGLLAAGVKIHERLGVVLHAKTAVIDGVWSAVGSSNLDWRSVIYNSEIDAVVLDRVFASEMEAMFQHEIARSKLITDQAWALRPIGERLYELFATSIARIL